MQNNLTVCGNSNELTKRELIAAMCLQGLLSNSIVKLPLDQMTALAVLLADAFIEKLAK